MLGSITPPMGVWVVTPIKSRGVTYKVMERILSYLKGTQDLVLWYLFGGTFYMVEFAGMDYIGYLSNTKSTCENSLTRFVFDRKNIS